MKIAICVHNLANGGAEHVAAMWATGFAEKGDEVLLVLAERNAPIEYSVSSKVRIENIHADGNSIIRYFRKIINLRSLLRRDKPDVALAVMKPWGEWLLLATMGLKTKVINTEHNSFERPLSAPMGIESSIRKFWLNKFFPAVTVLTAADKRVIGNRLKNVYVMPNPLAFTPHYDKSEKECIVLAAGRLDQWYVKGFDLLVQAWGMVEKNHPDWKLQIAGRGSQIDKLRILNWAADRNVSDKIELLGFCTDLSQICRKAEIFVLSSRFEGFGMVLIEAMSQGCAPVASNYNGRASDIIEDSKEGVLCPVEDVNSLSAAIELLISDEGMRRMMQESAYNRSKAFDIEIIIERWYDIFVDIGLS